MIEIPLAQIAPLNNGRVIHQSGACVVITAPGQWRYSAEAAFELPDTGNDPRRIEIRVSVETGRIGIGWISADGSTWISRTFLGRAAVPTDVALTVPADISGGRLIIENATEDGQPAIAVIERLAVRESTVVFLHVPKTGGTTITSLLSAVLPPAFEIHDDQGFCSFANLPASERNALRLIAGHMPYGIHRFIDGPVQYVTFLRDPVDRVISAYEHIKRTPDHPEHSRLADGSLLDFLSIDQDNQQVRRLVSYTLTDAQKSPDYYWWYSIDRHGLVGEHLQIAKEVLFHCAFVGLQEHLEEDVIELFQKLRLPRPDIVPRFQAAADKLAIADIPPEAIAALQEHTRLDRQLYEFARSLREQRRMARLAMSESGQTLSRPADIVARREAGRHQVLRAQ